MRFVVDGMLGGLARWLRILGYETEYDAKTNDNNLLERSRLNQAILLTRDEELYKRANARNQPVVLVRGENEMLRLAELAKAIGISLEVDMASTMCPQCGFRLHEISKEAASKNVPANSLKLYDKFWRCTNPKCAKTYWKGSHWKKIHQTLAEARETHLRD